MSSIAFYDVFSDNFSLHKHIKSDTADTEDEESPLPDCESSQSFQNANKFQGPRRPLHGCCMATRKSEVHNGRANINTQLVVDVYTLAPFRVRGFNGPYSQKNNLLLFPVSGRPACRLQNVTMLFSNPNGLAKNLGFCAKSTTKGQRVTCNLLVLHSTGSFVPDGPNHTNYDNDFDKLVRNMFTSPPTTKWHDMFRLPGPMRGIWIGLGLTFTIIAPRPNYRRTFPWSP
ncbi:uncharacterized protein LOC127873251 [Dreissena polymorpha]|uniref:Uncharacterized protein n=1 Tax=Dreissena polymorpha TaxID=45954 RepID=A0A9D4QXC8_DREPO|nr:uncharacterized protein LOC127873250 [Dreissena polymorpha]XP_052272989.1 uncharacterized protein LOC127873251 [Dreissena polymorpha]KAH3846227.1 hypothetical protein DPMN_088526 [Dreissena polymorpha]